jgi:hypothetical protein
MPLEQTPSPRLPLPHVAARTNFGLIKRPMERSSRSTFMIFMVVCVLVLAFFYGVSEAKIVSL